MCIFNFFFLILLSYLNFMQLDNLYVMYGLLVLINLNQQNLYTNVKRVPHTPNFYYDYDYSCLRKFYSKTAENQW